MSALIEDVVRLLRQMKDDRRLWNGDVGFSPAQREDVNELLRRHQSAAPTKARG